GRLPASPAYAVLRPAPTGRQGARSSALRGRPAGINGDPSRRRRRPPAAPPDPHPRPGRNPEMCPTILRTRVIDRRGRPDTALWPPVPQPVRSSSDLAPGRGEEEGPRPGGLPPRLAGRRRIDEGLLLRRHGDAEVAVHAERPVLT